MLEKLDRLKSSFCCQQFWTFFSSQNPAHSFSPHQPPDNTSKSSWMNVPCSCYEAFFQMLWMCAFNLVCPEINSGCCSLDCRSDGCVLWLVDEFSRDIFQSAFAPSDENISRAQVIANVMFFYCPVHSCAYLWVEVFGRQNNRDEADVRGNAFVVFIC